MGLSELGTALRCTPSPAGVLIWSLDAYNLPLVTQEEVVALGFGCRGVGLSLAFNKPSQPQHLMLSTPFPNPQPSTQLKGGKEPFSSLLIL